MTPFPPQRTFRFCCGGGRLGRPVAFTGLPCQFLFLSSYRVVIVPFKMLPGSVQMT